MEVYRIHNHPRYSIGDRVSCISKINRSTSDLRKINTIPVEKMVFTIQEIVMFEEQLYFKFFEIIGEKTQSHYFKEEFFINEKEFGEEELAMSKLYHFEIN